MPPLRDGPPYVMTDMIAAEPALAERLLTSLADDPAVARLAADIRASADAGAPITFTGCGTSEHAAMAAAAIVGGALRAAGDADARVASIGAFELLGRARADGVLVAISHEGGTWATNEALRQARDADAGTALVTVSGRSPGAELAGTVIQTHEQDQSWCHTVGYLSPIVAAIATAAAFDGRSVEGEVRASLAAGLQADGVAAVESMAGALADLDRIIVVAGGSDLIAARELVLKIEEGTHIPAAVREVETLLHGHLAAIDEYTGVVVIGADGRGAGARASRLANGLRATRELNAPATAILTTAYAGAIPSDLTPEGRVVIGTEAASVGHAARALLATTVPLQLLTERIARVRGVNPDPIRRDDPRYLRAAEAGSPGH